MKKGEIYEGIVEKNEFPDKGIVYIEGERVAVKYAIQGQEIRFLLNKKRKGKNSGRLLEILKPSPLETERDVCPHFGECGGCSYQTLPYEAQLAMKEGQVRALLDPVCPDLPFEGIIGSPLERGYRNKMEYSFGDEEKDGPLALGMHRRGSFYDIVTTKDCRIVHPDFCKILAAANEYFGERKIGFYRKLQHIGYLRHLLMRRAVKTGEILVDLVTTTQTETLPEDIRPEEEALLRGFSDRLLSLPLEGALAGILHTKNDSPADAVKDEGTDILYGRDYFFEEILGLTFRITPFSFFQTNSLGAERLYEKVREYVGETKGKVVFDLYSGTGTIAQMLAPVAERVVGVEIVEEAVGAARENALQNGLDNCEFIAGDVLKVLDELAKRDQQPDVIVLDPPRDGIHPKAIDKIAAPAGRRQVERIIYVSCKPTSLARDLAEFQKYGYEVGRVCCVDMFPGTQHVETVVLLTQKNKRDYHVEIEIPIEAKDEAEYQKEQKKATYTNIKNYIKERYGVEVHSSYIAQVRRLCGLDMRECYNKSKKEIPVKGSQCPDSKAKYIREALAFFEAIG